ncbi:MAG: hypothetical protein DRP65_06065 [Planctomycetota bacterium]|nr:MAG: hypothetical protein DRP65_06065 [Planctomycetota bacterium]
MQTGRGFTIVEVVAALVIVGAALVATCLAIPIFQI